MLVVLHEGVDDGEELRCLEVAAQPNMESKR